jgi:protein-S-isoprenylcysteine O-methyltransferase Ste14
MRAPERPVDHETAGMDASSAPASGPGHPTRIPDLGRRGEGWVGLQVVVFAAVMVSGFAGPAWTGPLRLIAALLGAGLGLAGLILVVWGIVALRRQLTALPRPGERAELVETGAFGLVRHPLYGGIVIAAVGWALVTASLPALAMAAVTGVFFDLKSRREEAWLQERFPAYDDYRRRVRKLIPRVY